ncbi:MAG: NrpR regulatory domain-containing protein [Candidatus Bathyarchaeota archaeon]|nr:NrpR regulatory domain-containing protein [Candidatus Bathyarchaeum sp.]
MINWESGYMLHENESARKEIEILRILSEFADPVGSTLLKRELRKKGFLLSERTVRYHLQLLEAKGFVLGHNRKGRTITQPGLEELSRALATQRLGFTTTRFMSLAYSANYNPEVDSGTVVTNVSLLDKNLQNKTLDTMKALQRMSLLSAPYLKVMNEKDEYCDISVPKGKLALLTVCNLTLDSILIHSGIPLFFKHGGLVQVLNRKPIRFVEIISYEGTTIPPLEVFVYRKMTSISSILKTGSGMLLATLREIPSEARERTVKILDELHKKEWGGVLVLGEPNEPVLGIPVGMDRFGICMVGGIVPGAAMVEEGEQSVTFAPHCIIPIEEMNRI